MLLDLASLSLSLLPPKGLFVKQKSKTAESAKLPARQQHSMDAGSRAGKPKLSLQITRVNVGVTSVVVGYQTAVEVAAADRQQGEGSPLTLMCTQCMTLQELTAEAYPLSYRGSLQMNNLAVTHQETQADNAPDMPSSGQSGLVQHEVDILRASHLSMQAEALTEHATALAASQGTAADGSASVGQADQGSSQLKPGKVAVKVALNGWRTSFHADAVIGLCKAAGDVSCVVRQTVSSLRPINLESIEVNSTAATVPAVDTAEAAAPTTKGDDTSRVMARLVKFQKLPTVRLTVEVTRWQTDITVAEHIVWGVRIAEVQLRLDSRTLLALQQQPLQAQLTQLPQQTQARSAESCHRGQLEDSTQAGEQSQQRSAAGMPEVLILRELLAASERPSLVARCICLTLNRKALLQCGEIDGSINLCPRNENQPGMSRAFSSSAYLGSPRRQASLGEAQYVFTCNIEKHVITCL